jgi:HK97 family phage portal protein
MIAEAAASVPFLLYEGEEEIAEHPLLDLLAQPSAGHTGTEFLEAWYGFLLVAGNAYAEAVAVGGALRELHALRPDRMKVLPGADGWPEAYEYSAGGRSVRFDAEPVTGVRPILHLKLFHPAHDHYGMSPIEAAANAIDIHNTASAWNKALLDNSARPSGALVYEGGSGRMTAEQFERLKAELETSFQGAKHAGRPLLLEGGLDWKTLSLSPKDMDFIEAKHAAAREIALAVGVPPMLLGIPGDNTYSNYQEAQRAFWRQTVLPLVKRTGAALSQWLAPAYAPGDSSSFAPGDSASRSRPPGALELRPDLDQVEALSSEREALWARLERASFLTANEKRTALGYGPLELGGDTLPGAEAPLSLSSIEPRGADLPRPFLKYSPDQPRVPRGDPEGGQWRDGGGGSGAASAGSDDRVISDANPDDATKPGARLAQADEPRSAYKIDLTEDEREGGHSIADHVGKTDDALMRRMQTERLETPFLTIARQRVGTFPSLESANKLVNATLAQNRQRVELVASGQISEAFVKATFDSPTGREAYAPSERAQPYIRVTHGVGVHIVHNPKDKKGFRVITAYPRND